MTAADLLAEEIRREGPIPFRRFMEVALYAPEAGYYRKKAHRSPETGPHPSDPFGKSGDFFTAEQIQPVFGILMAARIRQLYREMGEPRDFTVVEPGAGRAEMAAAFSEWRYHPLELDSGELPSDFTGVVFSNEFFDALPVDVAVWREGAFREQRVALDGSGAFVWLEAGPAPERVADYLRRYFPPPEEGRWYEANLAALGWMERIGRALRSGCVLTIDYGYTRAESVRFPAGTLMGYHRHTARENVLEHPGERDITAHVNFTALEEHGARCGLGALRLETLASTLLAAGEDDHFAGALEAAGPAEEFRRRMQLKTLLFGLGETFRVLLQRKEGEGEPETEPGK
ncbi:MAG TPA: SAM-dependent methyltransferase [Bryobacteraceae bacterium]|nr:SAM-dependent methyltransferase [Bryobacteraceae bacterium]